MQTKTDTAPVTELPQDAQKENPLAHIDAAELCSSEIINRQMAEAELRRRFRSRDY